jgi:3-phenylpropionate/trans-cinnamate dioxygenase ferredoxin reductase subunit
MTDYRYMIVGGGMAGHAALAAIREADAEGAAALFTAESNPPYKRPPLSKGLWKGESVKDIWYEVPDGVDLHTGRRIVGLDIEAHRVQDEAGEAHGYEKLLLATGGSPRRLKQDADGVIYFRDFADYERLRSQVDAGERFVVVGGGFIGTEIAAALAMQEREVTMIVPEAGLGSRVFPDDLSRHLVDYFGERGVAIKTGESVAAIRRRGDAFAVGLGDGDELEAGGVVVGIGITPDVTLARDAGLEVDDGILVDRQLRTNHPDVYAAGDVARFVPSALGSAMRFEHEDNAVTMGTVAGSNMAGANDEYDLLPLFYSDLFDLGYEAVGVLDNRMETVSDWKERFREGVVYYLDDRQRVRGALLWNVWGQVDAARSLIAEGASVTAEDLRGRITG